MRMFAGVRSGRRGVAAGLALAGATAAAVPATLAMQPRRAAVRAEDEAARVEEVRRAEVARQWEAADTIAARVEGLDGATAFREAKRLGIVDAITRYRPSLRATEKRRVAVAIVREARKRGLDPLFVTAVMRVESRFDPRATSHKGARGLLQVMPVTGRELAKQQGILLDDLDVLYDIETNVALGTEYLSHLLGRFRTERAALLAYNRGPRGARDTLRSEYASAALDGYPRAVLTEHARLRARAEHLASPLIDRPM